jgi:uncharacterized protein (DUF2267 family)
MNELVQLVQQKTGLSQDVAEKAVDAVLEFIKQKLPASMASSLESLLEGGAQAAAAAGATAQTAAATGGGKGLRHDGGGQGTAWRDFRQEGQLADWR